jgi:hypothetical protein
VDALQRVFHDGGAEPTSDPYERPKGAPHHEQPSELQRLEVGEREQQPAASDREHGPHHRCLTAESVSKGPKHQPTKEQLLRNRCADEHHEGHHHETLPAPDADQRLGGLGDRLGKRGIVQLEGQVEHRHDDELPNDPDHRANDEIRWTDREVHEHSGRGPPIVLRCEDRAADEEEPDPHLIEEQQRRGEAPERGRAMEVRQRRPDREKDHAGDQRTPKHDHRVPQGSRSTPRAVAL